MIDKIDLHSNSTASDGTYTPRELALLAARQDIRALALTDHDTVSGVREFAAACGEYGVEAVAGVEISAQYHKTMHIVGLFVDYEDEVLCEKLDKLRNARAVRNKKMLELLRKNGFDISEADILSQKEGASLSNTGRAHIARSMVEKHYVRSVNEAFKKYLKKGNSCYVKRITYSPEESIRIIKDTGGVAVLAHPVFITEDYDTLYGLAQELKEYGLDGMEGYYNCYTERFSKMCADICKKTGLLQSGGSDFHGLNKPDVELGTVSSGYVPYSLLNTIKEQRCL